MDRGTQAVVSATVVTALAGLFIILRVISRFVVVRSPGKEDYFIIGAMFLSVGLTISIDLQRRNGLGKHSDQVSLEQNVKLLKLLYSSILIYNLGLFIVKASLLYQYLRFFVERRWRRACHIMLAIVVVGGLAFMLAAVCTCLPVQKFWNDDIQGTCINKQIFWYSFATFNLVTDLACWLLPIPVLSKLKMPRKQKISLVLVFTLGGFGCIIGVLRLYYLYQSTISTDLTYDNVAPATWSAIELNVGIMCACVPALRPVLSLAFPGLLSSAGGNTTSNPYTRTHRSNAYYQRNESAVELSHAPSARRDSEALSHDTEPTSGEIRVKTDWTVTEVNMDLKEDSPHAR